METVIIVLSITVLGLAAFVAILAIEFAQFVKASPEAQVLADRLKRVSDSLKATVESTHIPS